MALSAVVKKLLNNINIGTNKVKLGDALDTAVSAASPVAATTTTAGVVKQSAAQANSAAADVAGVVTDFNALLAKLRTAGIIAP